MKVKLEARKEMIKMKVWTNTYNLHDGRSSLLQEVVFLAQPYEINPHTSGMSDKCSDNGIRQNLALFFIYTELK